MTQSGHSTAGFTLCGFDWMQRLPLDQYWAQTGPLWIDLGAGKGGFLAAVAQAFPDYRFLGVERQLDRVRRIDRRLVRLGLRNVRLLRAENDYTVRWLLPAASVDGFFILFPDPWPKKRHHKKRLITKPFLDALYRALKPGGIVDFATDHRPYSEWARDLWDAHPGFVRHEPGPTHMRVAETDFERLWRAQELPIHRLAYRAEAM